ncbi:MAG: hypothetical protein ABSD67_13305 [Terracidiphilus sp.]|jgi:hypothetical protein
MKSSQLISLFNDRADVSQGSGSIIVSVFLHGAVIGVVAYVVLYGPQIRQRTIADRLTVRHLNLDMPDPVKAYSEMNGKFYPGPHPSPHKAAPAGKPADEPAELQEITPAVKSLQTLMQPKAPQLPKDTPLPTVVLLTPETVPTKAIVAPKPTPPTIALAPPKLDLPNKETTLADIRLSATDLAQSKIPLVPSTTSPVVVRGPDLPQKAPQTVTNSTADPTSTTVVSLSDVQMKQGTVVLPPANMSASSNSQGTLADGKGQSQDDSQSTMHNVDGKGGTTTGHGIGDSKDKANGDKAGINGSGQGGHGSPAHIVLPKTGVFGSVVVGDSLKEKYPEIGPLWTGRLAYTVYLHVGLTKSWILQYSLPRAADAAAAGFNDRLNAPWPYNIVRPANGAGELDADALMIHGYVNKAGRFENLTILLPPDYAEAELMLESLRQWEFRPASQNGQSVRVEILLIIPEEEQ